MPKFSEDTFNTWRQPPSDHEESKLNNVQKQVKDAINKDSDLNKLSIDIFGQGSYANDTNVKLNSDIDINIMYKSEFYFDLPENTNNSDFGIVLSDKLSFSDYKNLIEKALVNEFGRSSVLRNNKCIRVASTPTRGECDVVPTFHYKRYSANKSFVEGIKFISDSNNVIVGFPKQHIQNAIDKNKITTFSTHLESWIAAVGNEPLPVLMEHILNQSGLLSPPRFATCRPCIGCSAPRVQTECRSVSPCPGGPARWPPPTGDIRHPDKPWATNPPRWECLPSRSRRF